MEVLDAQSYMADTPPGFIDSADVLPLLQDNKAVRAHSPYLASNSAVLHTLLAHLNSSKGKGDAAVSDPIPRVFWRRGTHLAQNLVRQAA